MVSGIAFFLAAFYEQFFFSDLIKLRRKDGLSVRGNGYEKPSLGLSTGYWIGVGGRVGVGCV